MSSPSSIQDQLNRWDAEKSYRDGQKHVDDDDKEEEEELPMVSVPLRLFILAVWVAQFSVFIFIVSVSADHTDLQFGW